jgi:hypothetical protein
VFCDGFKQLVRRVCISNITFVVNSVCPHMIKDTCIGRVKIDWDFKNENDMIFYFETQFIRFESERSKLSNRNTRRVQNVIKLNK